MEVPTPLSEPLPPSNQFPHLGAIKVPAVLSAIQIPNALKESWASEESQLSDRSLGNQFLMIAFPFTRLHLSETPEGALVESSITALNNRGKDVIIGDRESLTRLLEIAPLTNVYALSLKELSINVYDALFLRILSVSGILEVGNSQAASGVATIPIERTEYRKTGFSQEISRLFSDTLSQALNSAFQELERRGPHLERILNRRREPNVIKESPRPLLIVTPPHLATEKLETAGYFSQTQEEPGQIARAIQRGLHGGASATSLLVASTSSPNLLGINRLNGFSELSTNLGTLTIRSSDRLLGRPVVSVRIDLRLTELKDHIPVPIRSASCYGEMPLVRSTANPGPKTLQLLAARISETFLSGKEPKAPETLVRCE